MANERKIVIGSEALQLLEDYINDEEDTGRLLNSMGIISDEELAAGIHKMEDFRVKLEADPALAEAKAKELDETGTTVEVQAAETGV